MKKLKLLVGCEESQVVTIAFRELGHEAYSCDLEPCSGGHPEWHLQMDIFDAFRLKKWDLKITFQPCTDLAVSGAKHFEGKRNDGRQEASIRFFYDVWKQSDCSENPIGILGGGDYIKKWFPALYEEMKANSFPFKPSQIIQPWQFGDEAQKSTCLWIKNLPLLKPTNIVGKGNFYTAPSGKTLPAWYGDAVGESGKKIAYGSKEMKQIRSKTFPGIAKAMAEQWGVEQKEIQLTINL